MLYKLQGFAAKDISLKSDNLCVTSEDSFCPEAVLSPPTMNKSAILVLLIVVFFSFDVDCQNHGGAPPQSPEELTNYLKALNEYYAIVARPRFGRSIIQKRSFLGALTDGA